MNFIRFTRICVAQLEHVVSGSRGWVLRSKPVGLFHYRTKCYGTFSHEGIYIILFKNEIFFLILFYYYYLLHTIKSLSLK